MLIEREVRTEDDYRDVPVLDMVVRGPDFAEQGYESVVMRATFDTAADVIPDGAYRFPTVSPRYNGHANVVIG